MSEIPLVDDLKYWRAERADEWVMDRFIRKAEQLTEENKKLKKDFDASKRFYEEVGYQKKSEDLQDKLDKVKNNLEFMIANGRNWGFPTATYAKQALTELEEK